VAKSQGSCERSSKRSSNGSCKRGSNGSSKRSSNGSQGSCGCRSVAYSQWSHNATAATEKDGALGGEMCTLGGSNFRSVSKGQGGPNRQGITRYAISQGISDIIRPQDIAIWTQVAEATDLVASSVL
jgi:hypothetical protein